MASKNKRMFSMDIVDSDDFLDLPASSQNLYFHLNMRADDDGFITPKKIMRMIGSSDDDYKILVGKRFLIEFENSVCVIKHWLIHNTIRKDRYFKTKYNKEKDSLSEKENKSYTEIDNKKEVVTTLATKRQPRRDKDKDKDKEEIKIKIKEKEKEKVKTVEQADKPANQINDYIEELKELNPVAYTKWFKNKTQRENVELLIKRFTINQLRETVSFIKLNENVNFFPSISTPMELVDKLQQVKRFYKTKGHKKKEEYEVIP